MLMRQTKFNDGQWIFNNDANPSEVIKKILRIFLYGKGAESGLISVDQNHNAKRLSITSINPVILSSAIFMENLYLKRTIRSIILQERDLDQPQHSEEPSHELEMNSTMAKMYLKMALSHGFLI